MKLAGKRALITGGGRGIGRALAAELAGQGASLIIVGREQASLDQTAKTIGGDITAIAGDIADRKTISRLEAVIGAAGGLDLLFNNAAIQLHDNFFAADTTGLDERIDHEVSVNFTAPLKLIVACLPALRKSTAPAIINIGSGLALAPKASAPVYCATKSALRTFSRTLRYQADLQQSPVRVVDVILPMVATDMTEGRGKGKIPARQAALEILAGVVKQKAEIYVGKTRVLKLIMRAAPSLGYKLLRGSLADV